MITKFCRYPAESAGNQESTKTEILQCSIRDMINLQAVVLSRLVMVTALVGQAGERDTYIHNDVLGSVVAVTDDYGQFSI